VSPYNTKWRARAEAYLHADFHLHPSNPLATVHQRYRQDRLSVLSCLSVVSVYNVGVLWPNGWMDQDETWQNGMLLLLSPGHIVLDPHLTQFGLSQGPLPCQVPC